MTILPRSRSDFAFEIYEDCLVWFPHWCRPWPIPCGCRRALIRLCPTKSLLRRQWNDAIVTCWRRLPLSLESSAGVTDRCTNLPGNGALDVLGPEASPNVAALALAAAPDLSLIPDAALATPAPTSRVNSSGELPPIPKSSWAESKHERINRTGKYEQDATPKILDPDDASIGVVAPITLNAQAADDKSVFLRKATKNLSCQTAAIGQDHTTDADSLELVVDNQMVSLLPDEKAEESHEDPVLKEQEELKPVIEPLCGSVLQPPSLKPASEVCMLASPVLPEHTIRDCEPQCNIVSPVRQDAICLRAVASSEDASIDPRGSSSSGEYVSSFHDL
ncbi:hypothetical protein Nepgr_013576 [Nepenthes gracilis]|uniref:Uncharacterized protein n=1 Tax=Nepenthes gracilis TaxID=150966 RepID=A0AAD3SHQ7_NEPGR|nr:hypothetical protein Nepgr_013576 [Nepenthes gracilis]